jgi:hypothetical protein
MRLANTYRNYLAFYIILLFITLIAFAVKIGMRQ